MSWQRELQEVESGDSATNVAKYVTRDEQGPDYGRLCLTYKELDNIEITGRI